MAKRSFLDYFFTESTLVGIPTAFGSVFVEASSRELASALRSRVLIPALIRSGPAGARKFVIRECWMLEYPSHSGPSGRLPSMVLGIGLWVRFVPHVRSHRELKQFFGGSNVKYVENTWC